MSWLVNFRIFQFCWNSLCRSASVWVEHKQRCWFRYADWTTVCIVYLHKSCVRFSSISMLDCMTLSLSSGHNCSTADDTEAVPVIDISERSGRSAWRTANESSRRDQSICFILPLTARATRTCSSASAICHDRRRPAASRQTRQTDVIVVQSVCNVKRLTCNNYLTFGSANSVLSLVTDVLDNEAHSRHNRTITAAVRWPTACNNVRLNSSGEAAYSLFQKLWT